MDVLSKDMTAAEAVDRLKDMSKEEAAAFTEGETRKTVLAAVTAMGEAEEAPADVLAFERPYATIEIPKGSDPKDQKTVTVNVQGTLKDGRPYQFHRVFRRGFPEHNVPANVRQALNDLIITNIYAVEKADRSGYEKQTEQVPRWSFTIREEYDEKKTEEQVKAELAKVRVRA